MTSIASSLRAHSRIGPLREELARLRENGRSIAFVPTMGALHEGHLRLIDRARAAAHAVVLSIFVNPLQFGPSEDFTKYPRDLANDSRLAEERGVDLLFIPERQEMYPEEPRITVSPGALGEIWEGESRPGHFCGVLTVVAKLFNIVEPDFAVFGQKDLQQLALVHAMIRELAFPIEILSEPIVRDQDGLALSSRNQYLKPPERAGALSLPRALAAMRDSFRAGRHYGEQLETAGREVLESAEGVTCDYLAVIDPGTFQRVENVVPGCAAIGAIRVGRTRLIDNVIF